MDTDKREMKKELGKLILERRHYRALTMLLMFIASVLLAALYFQLTYPAFLPNTLTNPAVLKFITSSEFESTTGQSFEQLERYNKRALSGHEKLPNEFFSIDPSQFGLIVTLNYKLIETSIPGRETIVPFYKFQPNIAVRLEPRILICLLAIELVLWTVIAFIHFHKPHSAHLKMEDSILESIYQDEIVEMVPIKESKPNIEVIRSMLRNFHAYCLQLNRRRTGRSPLEISDEYDVQDALHALLKLYFDDVRDEEPTPSVAGGGARIDFLLFEQTLAIEVKMTRKGLKDRELGDQLFLDVKRYSEHSSCTRLICFVYDPQHLVTNPAALVNDLANASTPQLAVEVILSPALHST